MDSASFPPAWSTDYGTDADGFPILEHRILDQVLNEADARFHSLRLSCYAGPTVALPR